MDCVNSKSGKWQNNVADKSCPGQLQKHRFFVRPDETVPIGAISEFQKLSPSKRG